MSEQHSAPDIAGWRRRLEGLGLAVRRRLVATRDAGHEMAAAVAQEGGDTIFAIDRHVEPVIDEVIASWPDTCKPLLLIAEGMGHDGRKRYEAGPGGAGSSPLRYRLIIDPIDGTRNIMYDKRSAWFLAAVAVDRGEATRLSDTFASTMVELPPSKQMLGDSFTAGRGAGLTATRSAVGAEDAASASLTIRPSAAATLKHGFAQVTNFFPGTKVLASDLMERIALATLGEVRPGEASVFDDQYMTTGGQMVELMVGHDRFCCDLRPLFYKALEKRDGKIVRGLECHPYDAAGALVATEAGVVLTDGFGRALDAPLDVASPVHWCGYANETLRRAIEPVIVAWLREQGVEAD